MGIGNGGRRRTVLGNPLVLTGGALRELPFIAEQVFQEVLVPFCRIGRPGALQSAGEGVGTLAGAILVFPAQALLFDGGALRFATDIAFRTGTVSLSERMSAGNERDRLVVIHRHAAKRLPDIVCRGHWIRLSAGPLGIHVDQPHLNRAKGILELTGALVPIFRQPYMLRAPVGLVWLPDVLASAAEAESLEPHRFQGDVTGENHEVGPGDFPSILPLYWPEQPARLVEARVVRPAIERRKTLIAGARPAAAVADTVRTCAVPRHTNEQRTVVAIVCRPPFLRVRHQGIEVLDHGLQVEALEFFGIVEIPGHRTGRPLQDFQIRLIRPPVCVGRADGLAAGYRALAFA